MLNRIRKMLGQANSELRGKSPDELALMISCDPEIIDDIARSVDRATMGGLLHQVHDSPLLTDSQLWLHFIPHAVRVNVFKPCDSMPPPEQVYPILAPLHKNIKDASLSCDIGAAILHSDLDSAQVKEIVTRCVDLAHSTQANIQYYQWYALFASVSDKELLRQIFDRDLGECSQSALRVYSRLLKNTPWVELYDLAQQDPERILELRPTHTDCELWRIMWANDTPECQRFVVARLRAFLQARLRSIEESEEDVFTMLSELLNSDRVAIMESLIDPMVSDWTRLATSAAEFLLSLQDPEITVLMPALLSSNRVEPEEGKHALLQQLLEQDPTSLIKVAPNNLASVLSACNDQLLLLLSPTLLKMSSKSTSKTLREPVIEALVKLSPGELATSGWATSKNKNVKSVWLELLLTHSDSAALDYLRALVQCKSIEQIDIDRVLEHLQLLGEDIDELDEMSENPIAFAEASAAGDSSISKSVDGFYDDTLAVAMPCLSSQAIRWLLQQMSAKTDSLSRTTRCVLNVCPAAQRALFTDLLIAKWVAAEGDPGISWSLKILESEGSDELVGILSSFIAQWHKKQKTRAVRAVEALGQIGSIAALAEAKAVAETKRNPPSVVEAARVVLANAAIKRGVSLAALFDELVPDFGLNGEEGLALDVGPYAYHVKLTAELELTVVSPAGKVTKTLPKAKPDEDPQLRQKAEARFKQLRKNLKQLAKDQINRLPMQLMGVRTWSASAWRKCYVEHPVFRTLAHTLIWTLRGENNSVLCSFRLSEDLSLIDQQDNPVELPDQCRVSLWHPIDENEDARKAWIEHIADYTLKPVLEQVTLPAHHLQPDWLVSEEVLNIKDGIQSKQLLESLAPFQGHVVKADMFNKMMTRWNYRKGAPESRGRIYEHTLNLEDVQLGIVLVHTSLESHYESGSSLALQSIEIERISTVAQKGMWKCNSRLEPSELPPALLSVLYEQMKQLAQSGSGYHENWREM